MSQLILENEALIYKIASYFKGIDIEDLYQAGCQGIIEAYNNYDNSKAKFTTYAYSYIYGQMLKVARENKGIKVSRDIRTLRKKILKTKDIMMQMLEREPTTLEISNYLELPETYVIEAINSNIAFQSMESNINDMDITLEDIIGAPSTDYDTLLYLKMELEKLKEPEKSIMLYRYFEDKTQTEVASALGLTQSVVSKKENKVLKKIRQLTY